MAAWVRSPQSLQQKQGWKFKSKGGSSYMRVKMSIIYVILCAFLLGIFAPLSASAVVHRRYAHHYYVKHRSKKKQAAIIGGSAAGGAAIGALAGGGKGALIGAGIGAAGGAIYNHKTKNK